MNTDLHESLFDEIEAQINTLRAGAPATAPGEEARSLDQIDATLADLESDKQLLLAHWRTADGVSGRETPPRARACGRPQPCPHVLGLAQKYGYV